MRNGVKVKASLALITLKKIERKSCFSTSLVNGPHPIIAPITTISSLYNTHLLLNREIYIYIQLYILWISHPWNVWLHSLFACCIAEFVGCCLVKSCVIAACKCINSSYIFSHTLAGRGWRMSLRGSNYPKKKRAVCKCNRPSMKEEEQEQEIVSNCDSQTTARKERDVLCTHSEEGNKVHYPANSLTVSNLIIHFSFHSSSFSFRLDKVQKNFSWLSCDLITSCS